MKRTRIVFIGMAAIGGLGVLAGCGSSASVPGKMGKAPTTQESNLPVASDASSQTSPSSEPDAGQPVTGTPPAGVAPSEPAPETTSTAPTSASPPESASGSPGTDGPSTEQPSGPTPTPGGPPRGVTGMPPKTPPMQPAEPTSVKSSDGSYTIRIAAKAGDSFKYRTTSKMTMDLGSMASMLGEKGKKPLQFTATTDMQRKFTKISPAGFAVEETVLDVKTSEGSGTGVMGMMGQGMKQAKGTKAVTEYDANGRVKPTAGKASVSSGGDLASMSGLVGFQGMVLPSNPVKVGDTWSDKIDFQKMMNSMNPAGARFKMSPVPVKTTFVRVEDVGGIKVGVFSVVINAKPSMEANADKTAMKMDFALASESTVKIDMRTGLIRESVGTYRNKISMGGMSGARPAGMPSSVTMTQTATVSVKRI